jgi:hypothetical protein
MPNWCLNNLIVSHADKAMVQKFADAYNTGGVCQQFIPMPEGEDWYSWNVSNWGSKWDFGTDKNYDDPVEVKQNGDKYEVTVAPSTAWSPPIEFYDHLVGLGYKVHASYFEPGMGFCGIYNDGYDNYIDYGDDKDSIPVGVWNDFALDDFFEMMEEEA